MGRSGRDESILVVIHMCMGAMVRISLYSYPYLKLAKMLSFFLLLMCSLQQNWRRGQNRFFLEVKWVGRRGGSWRGGGEQGEEMAQTMYAHMNKYKNK
jgi:hypothetical protein